MWPNVDNCQIWGMGKGVCYYILFIVKLKTFTIQCLFVWLFFLKVILSLERRFPELWISKGHWT